jgi:hypothetical protein
VRRTLGSGRACARRKDQTGSAPVDVCLDAWPLGGGPVVDGGLVAFGGAAHRALHRPAEPVGQQRPHVRRMVTHPVSHSMTTAMRSRAHSSPTNPLVVAPSRRACSTRPSWGSDSLGAGPVGPRLSGASGPPACQRACHSLTLGGRRQAGGRPAPDGGRREQLGGTKPAGLEAVTFLLRRRTARSS